MHRRRCPLTGRLARLGDPLSFVLRRLAPLLPPVRAGAHRLPVHIAVRDSRSDPDHARQAVKELVTDEGAHIVITMAGTQVLPAVADACADLRTPCLSTTFPRQAYEHCRTAAERDRWTYHFAWGLEDIAAVFADMWERVGGVRRVACLWNDELQGDLLRRWFAPVAAERGRPLVDPGAYREGTADFGACVEHLRRHDVNAVTSAATGADLARFHQRAREAGLDLRLLTCSRWLTYPHAESAPAPRDRAAFEGLVRARVATLVYWTPRHPHRSSVDGTTSAELADAYQQATGRMWLQPLGLAHALVDVAHHALSRADDPTDRASVAAALSRTRLETVVGPLDWTAGDSPNVARVPLAGGQWHPKPPTATNCTSSPTPRPRTCPSPRTCSPRADPRRAPAAQPPRAGAAARRSRGGAASRRRRLAPGPAARLLRRRIPRGRPAPLGATAAAIGMIYLI